ncbi:hypothetical protein NS115_11435 [Paenibacillus jamilae]|uniref:Uncharacterized protein n=1 Tax=Paenibacillus jamilae TaxID=114136 RepID=A0ACC4ZVB7_9BACL|nr:hypothetical protein [Paenibacillus jamilae]AUO07885.1 hypothetical protein C0638_15785 [Paenibacillus sp. lzh-N1]KTS82486.1 hypothetical protein NS115_11435 [Paenibacillus jamilae]
MAYESKGTFYESHIQNLMKSTHKFIIQTSVVVSMEQMDMECTLTQEVEINEKKKGEILGFVGLIH